MNPEIEVHKGYLLLPSSGKLIMKKTWHQKYCYLYKASKFGIERLEIYENPERSKSPAFRIITLENCIKITPETDLRFTITTKSNPVPYEFQALNIEEKAKWLLAFQSVAFPDDTSAITIEEDNDLYCSSGEGIFYVRIHPSNASERCRLEPHLQYVLVLNSTAMQLKSVTDGAILYTWPYCFIRRYGYKSGKFTFEAGRKCDSGEGIFFLEHSNQQEIFRCISSRMKSMRKFLKDSDSSGHLDCGDNQFQAALSMEARSRSPLPPSPTASTTLHDIDSIEKPRQKPVKPPRKSLAGKQTSDYEPVDKYDCIEYRNDAWKTLGINEVRHTEVTPSSPSDDDIYMSWGDIKQPLPTVKQSNAPKIIKQPLTDDNYDKLEFFGSSNKLNVKSGYKQIAVNTGTTYTPSFNDYDEVQPAMEEIRLADDKHLGYALVRKGSGTSKDKNESVNHQFHNDEPYAVISKPKRV